MAKAAAMSLLEITGDDIAKLDDGPLRELIGLLCEADFRRSGLSAAGVTWGGNQDAADGGFDVVVSVEGVPPEDGCVQRRQAAGPGAFLDHHAQHGGSIGDG